MRTTTSPTNFHFHDLAAHFLALGLGDRFLRFGWEMTDEQIVAYVESLYMCGDSVLLVVEPDGDVSGVLHLESMGSGVTVGLSVSAWARNMGIGTLLLPQARVFARARGLDTLFARNLNLNPALRRLAQRVGMRVSCADGTLSMRRARSNDYSADGESDASLITLADDSLRFQWNGARAGATPFELAEPILIS
ncbi:MAG: GNAT family N-acetyltransferase [Burkholderiaceae bacterium]|nr:GNAT family N-acetyltransferase [Burkholderiaceae bacterium]